MIDTVKFFKEKKYVLIKEMIPKDIAKVGAQYSHYDKQDCFNQKLKMHKYQAVIVFMVTHLWKHF